MESSKVLILTEGSKEIGFGHITRMLAIYEAFLEKNIRPKFIINGDNTILDLIKNTDHEVYNWLKEEKIFNEIQNSDIMIIDSYLADFNFYKKISELVKLPVYYDDNNRLDYPRGIVVNGNIHAKDLNYPEKKDVIYLLGIEFLPIRKEFWHVKERNIREKVQKIMITFGGNDFRDLIPLILKKIKDDYPEELKRVIIGKGFNNIKEIERQKDANTELIFYPDADKIKEIMLDSDIAISAAGQTLYELSITGTPTIAIGVADNQKGNINGFTKNNLIKFAGWWDDENLVINLKKVLEELESFQLRKDISQKMQKLIDGKGVIRLVNELKNIKSILK